MVAGLATGAFMVCVVYSLVETTWSEAGTARVGRRREIAAAGPGGRRSVAGGDAGERCLVCREPAKRRGKADRHGAGLAGNSERGTSRTRRRTGAGVRCEGAERDAKTARNASIGHGPMLELTEPLADDHFHDECGVFGIFGHVGRGRAYGARPARVAAPGPGVGGHHQLRRRAISPAPGARPRRRHLRLAICDRPAYGVRGHRPQPVFDRGRNVAPKRATAVRRVRFRRIRGCAQRQPYERLCAAPIARQARLHLPIDHGYRGDRPPDRDQFRLGGGRAPGRRAQTDRRRLLRGRHDR